MNFAEQRALAASLGAGTPSAPTVRPLRTRIEERQAQLEAELLNCAEALKFLDKNPTYEKLTDVLTKINLSSF